MRARFWVGTACGGLSGFLCLLTLVWKDWLEGESENVQVGPVAAMRQMVPANATA